MEEVLGVGSGTHLRLEESCVDAGKRLKGGLRGQGGGLEDDAGG